MSKKKTIEEVQQSFESEGYQLLTTEYYNSHQKLDFICPKGHNHSINWSSFSRGSRCGRCKGNIEVTYNQVKSSFESEGYILISTEYNNARSRLHFICPSGHTHYIDWMNWRLGNRCGKCANRYNTLIDTIRESLSSEGYRLITKEYRSYDKIQFTCPLGHIHSMMWGSWIRGNRCGICDNKYISYDQIKQSFESEGYKLLSKEYINSSTKLDFICPEGHYHKIVWNSWQQGVRCGKCNTSKPELQLLHYIKFRYPYLNIVHNDRTTIINPNTGKYLEFDIWIPELNKAIEMNGVAVHYSTWSITNDILKNQLCEEKGIELLVVTDEEWYNNIDVNSKIHEFIGDIK